MSSSVNNILDEDSIILKYQAKINDKSKKKTKKNNQIISEKVGNYYCKYLVDEKGNKTLVGRVPASSVENKKSSTSVDNSVSKVCDNNTLQNTPTAFHHKQQMSVQSKHKNNLNDVLNMLKDSMGIPRNKKRIGISLNS